MNTYEKHINLLGYRAKDKITGYWGVIESVYFDLYGCIQVSLRPRMNEKGEVSNGYWFDVTRVEILPQERVVSMPNFYDGYTAEGKKGAADKPNFRA